jgi:hypothetical protein
MVQYVEWTRDVLSAGIHWLPQMVQFGEWTPDVLSAGIHWLPQMVQFGEWTPDGAECWDPLATANGPVC